MYTLRKQKKNSTILSDNFWRLEMNSQKTAHITFRLKTETWFVPAIDSIEKSILRKKKYQRILEI